MNVLSHFDLLPPFSLAQQQHQHQHQHSSSKEENKHLLRALLILFSHVILSLIDKYDKLVLLSERNYDD